MFLFFRYVSHCFNILRFITVIVECLLLCLQLSAQNQAGRKSEWRVRKMGMERKMRQLAQTTLSQCQSPTQSMYYIVEFTEESSVGIVAQCWVYEDEGQQYSYWPPTNQTKRAKKEELPDEEKWISRKICVFARTGDFERAQKWSKTAEYTSAVESDDSKSLKRPKNKPSRFEDSSDDENALWVPPATKRKYQDGPFPHLKATFGTERKKTDKLIEAKLPTPPQLQPNVDEPPRTSSKDAIEDTNEERQPWARSSRDASMPKELKEILQVLLQKVESLAASQREIILLLRRNQGRQREEDILELNIAQTKEELENLEHHLKEAEFRKKVTHHLSLIGGANPGECVRRVMRIVATNIVWSHYSLLGKREKLPLIGTTVCKVIKHAVMKCKAGLGEKDVECLIGETLKHAPAQLKKRVQGRLNEDMEE